MRITAGLLYVPSYRLIDGRQQDLLARLYDSVVTRLSGEEQKEAIARERWKSHQVNDQAARRWGKAKVGAKVANESRLA
ncbi:MAG: hypothetical protein ACM359_11430 [Bacillota bacterium]